MNELNSRNTLADDEFDGDGGGDEFDEVDEDENIDELDQQEDEGGNIDIMSAGDARGVLQKSKRITPRYTQSNKNPSA